MQFYVLHILQKHFPLIVRLIPVRPPGHNRVPHLLTVHPHIHRNLIRQLCIREVHRVFYVHKHLPVSRVTGPLAVQIISDEGSSSITKYAQRGRVPVVFKPLSCQKDGGYNALIKYAFYKFTET